MVYELQSIKGPQPHVYESKTGSTVCALEDPIEFPFELNRKAVGASLTHAEDDGTKWLYHIRFSDGYQSVFTIDRTKGMVLEKTQKTPSAYAKAIADDIAIFYGFQPFQPHPFCLLVEVKGWPVKVWAKQDKEACWVVAYEGKYHFFVHLFSGKWTHEPLDNITGTYVVPEVVHAVVGRINETTTLVMAPTN